MMERSFGDSCDSDIDADARRRLSSGAVASPSPTKKPIAEGLEGLQMIMIVRDSMKNARPMSEDEKYGGDGMMSYHIFKNNFKSATREDILPASDIINEATNWTKGRPRNIVKTFLGNKNPEAALQAMWVDLDAFYGLKTSSIEERVRNFSKGPKFDRDDLEAHIDLVT